MGYTRQCKANTNVQTVRKMLADGTAVVYRYHLPSRTRLMSEPGTDAFALEVAEIRRRSKVRPAEAVYFIRAVRLGLIKIGIANDLAARIRALRTSSPDRLELLGVIPGGGKVHETELHRRFAEHRSHGEWFFPVPELMAVIEDAKVLTPDGSALFARRRTG